MRKSRLESFSDGVVAILITIMVLELRAPRETTWDALRPLLPVFLTYVLSFLYLAIYWNNHHHMFVLVHRVNGTILWANLHLLFWLSLIPFATSWLGENQLAPVPTAAYGGVLLCAALAWLALESAIIADQGRGSVLREAVGSEVKGKVSSAAYVVAIGLSYVAPRVSIALYAAVAALWLVPDRRIESRVAAESDRG